MSKLIKNGKAFIEGKWQEVNILIEDGRFAYIGNEEKISNEACC